jgi:predicted nucleotide-binding protein
MSQTKINHKELLMDSRFKQVELLLDQGKVFNFRNFSLANGPTYGGKDTPERLAWKTRVANLLPQLLDGEAPPIELLKQGLAVRTDGNGEDKFQNQQRLLIGALESTLAIAADDTFGELKKAKAAATKATVSNKVFVVHGHDDKAKTELEVFLSGIGLEPVVLHREADEGRTIIEKFEKHSDVGFAFILLTPDEIAYTVDQAKVPEGSRKTELRARPNVIFEFGFFVAKLTRSKVCCLIKGEVSRPSDLDGLIYKKITGDIESIGYGIIKELKAAGYSVSI